MSLRTSKRSNPSNEEVSLSSSDSSGEEKSSCIPFLRRLTDMLSENDDVISFIRGYQKSNGETVLGKIVVHDRVKVESSVLPRYFNHSSFASLRRQLNYFSFTRNGKGRQRGATYCNEGVIELEDILNLKRRSVTGGSVPAPAPSALVKTISKTSSVSSAPKRKDLSKENPKKRIRTKSRNETHGPSELAVRTEISPIASFVSSDEEHTSSEQPKIALDLTITSTTPAKSFPPAFRPMTVLQDASCRFPPYDKGDEDLLAGCRALLNFSKGISSR